MTSKLLLFALIFVAVNAFGPLCNNFTRPLPKKFPIKTPFAEAKVAFVGDQGLASARAGRVLQLVRDWGADPLVILGDFDYVNSPAQWWQLISGNLGDDYPILAVGGNHDVPAWSGYQQLITENLKASGIADSCTGTPGVDMACYYKGIFFLLNQVGTRGSISSYITSATRVLEANKEIPWKFCGWHKNQQIYQTGDKSDETGYEILDLCRRYGAVVCTAHEHSYSRSVLMSDFASADWVEPKQIDDLQLSLGESFVFVSGLGGNSIRAWRGGAQNNPWWAANAASDNGVNYAALLCTFSGDSAHCEETDIDGYVWDSFTIHAPTDLTAPVPPPKCSAPFLEIGVTEDLHEDISGLVHVNAPVLSLTQNAQKIALRFTNVPISSSDKISSAHLQIFGIKSAPGDASVTIRAEISSDSQSFGKDVPMKAVTIRKNTVKSVTWTKTDGETEWESGEVWVSPNIKEILEEIIAQPDWNAGNAITLVVEGTGAPRHVYTRDSDDCLAPTLSIALEQQC